MAVHEEKLIRQEEALEENEKEIRESVQELHSRITTNAKETSQHMSEVERRLVDAMSQHSQQSTEQIMKLREEIQTRVGVLEKWRYLIIGGSIVIGFGLTEILPIFM